MYILKNLHFRPDYRISSLMLTSAAEITNTFMSRASTAASNTRANPRRPFIPEIVTPTVRGIMNTLMVR